MKVALVILHADAAVGGAERYTIDLAQALSGRSHDVSVLAATVGSGLPGEIRQVALPTRRAGRLDRYRGFLESLDAHLEENRYDVVHAMLPVRRCDLYHPHAGIATEAVIGGDWSSRLANRFNRKRQFTAAVERKLLESERPPVVLCLSNYVKRTLRRHYPRLAEDRQITLHNGIDLGRFDPSSRPDAGIALRKRLGLAADQVVGLMLAQDFERKGLRQTIQAMARLSDPKPALLVAGRDDPSAYQRLARELGVAEMIQFVGPTDDAYSFYRAADFFVLPTRHDPCSLVVLEALAMGVGVISSVFNGACEVMESERHGIVLDDPQDLDALTAALSTMLDPNLRRQFRENILSLRPRLSQDAHVDAIEHIYRGVGADISNNC